MKLIGVSGKKRSGKDFFYQIVNARFMAPKIAMRRYAFADAVKSFAAEYFGYPEKAVAEEKEKNRFILQGIGQMMREEVSRDFWVERTFNDIKRDSETFLESGINFIAVITDVRYFNEAENLRDIGGHLVRIRRDETVVDTHPSEISLDDYEFDSYVDNYGDKREFITNIDGWVKQWQKSSSQVRW